MGLKYAGCEDLCYPGTHVLINTAGIRDQATLNQFESECVMARTETVPPWQPGAAYFCSIHRHLFQDVYAWAGECRNCVLSLPNPGAPDSLFCLPKFIPVNLDQALAQVSAVHLRRLSDDELAALLGSVVTALNVVHPFREGNGRTMRAYADQVALSVGRTVDFSTVTPEEWHYASVQGFNTDDSGPMARLFARALCPVLEH